jgi:hypothetical protein
VSFIEKKKLPVILVNGRQVHRNVPPSESFTIKVVLALTPSKI